MTVSAGKKKWTLKNRHSINRTSELGWKKGQLKESKISWRVSLTGRRISGTRAVAQIRSRNLAWGIKHLTSTVALGHQQDHWRGNVKLRRKKHLDRWIWPRFKIMLSSNWVFLISNKKPREPYSWRGQTLMAPPKSVHYHRYRLPSSRQSGISRLNWHRLAPRWE